MFDVFYIGPKPNLFVHEQEVSSIEQAQQQSRTRYFWMVNYLTDYTGFDFLWEPTPWQADQRHAWASQWQKDSGTYLVPRHGYTDTNYHSSPVLQRHPCRDGWTIPSNIDADSFDFSWHPDPTDPPLTYYFGTQWQRTGGPVYNNGSDTVKIVPTPLATALPSKDFWSVPDGIDLEHFDFSWHPDVFDGNYVYQFGTQHQRTGGPQYRRPGAVDIKFVDQVRSTTIRVASAVYEIDHLDGNAGKVPQTVKSTRFFDNYLDTLKRIAKSIPAEHEYVWICSSVCDYKDFDFSWHPEQWQSTMLHVFPSDGEKFGDTFFMHVPTFRARIDNCQLLEWYDLNFVADRSVPRRPLPVIEHTYDTHVEAVQKLDWSGPLAVFTTHNTPASVPCVPLWREKTKTVVPMSAGASSVIVPKAAVPYIKKQIYDYPYIDKTQRHLRTDAPLDIVFISNGESVADYHYEKLRFYVGDYNRIKRSDGINGRVSAYHAAAELSTTPWFFAVFAKLLVDEHFDWSWQPDRLQEPKHYIFHAKNPCNGLIYGHQAMIAYNRQLTLSNPGQGLDFTLDSPHEVVPILSGVAHYNATPWMAWRTAFREVLKLRASLPDVENEYRINRWCSNGDGNNSQWSSQGAQDALEYYTEVGGDFDALKKSYEWSWLASYAMIKRGLVAE